MSSPWNSLEIVRLSLSSLTPVVLAGFGVYIHRITKRFENRQWVSQKLVEKRLAIYDQIAPLLNDLLCYFTYVGCWKELDPPDLIKLKRTLDKAVNLAAPLFPKSFCEAYKKFEVACFHIFGGWGEDARLRTKFERRQTAHRKAWDGDWSKHFSDEGHVDPVEIQRLYGVIMHEFTTSFGDLGFVSEVISSRIPMNIK